MVSRDSMVYCYHSTKDLENDIERGKHFFKKDYVKNYFKEIDKIYTNHWKVFKTLDTANFKEYSNEQLFKLYKKAVFHWSKMISYFRSSQAEGTHRLVQELKKTFTDEEATLLMTPTELDLANKETLDWQKLLTKSYSKKGLINHAKKYPWAVMSHYTLDDAIETLTQRYNFDKKHPQEFDFVSEKKKIKKKQELLLKEHRDRKKLVDLFQKIATYRMRVKSCWAGLDFYKIKLVNEIAQRSKESLTDISKYYLIKDVKNLLNGKPLPSDEIKKRKECFVGLWKNGKAIYISGKKAEEIAKRELKDLYAIKDREEIKGIAAYPGKTRGIARMLPPNNMEKTRELRKNFRKGEILFTGMTQPAIMDIASKAGAIVTDEGGMLSHAAIISREFKIPCIVGTHFGTQIFKEGDLVEVDANKGVIKKLKKK